MSALPFIGPTMGAYLNTNKIFVLIKEAADDDGWLHIHKIDTGGIERTFLLWR